MPQGMGPFVLMLEGLGPFVVTPKGAGPFVLIPKGIRPFVLRARIAGGIFFLTQGLICGKTRWFCKKRVILGRGVRDFFWKPARYGGQRGGKRVMYPMGPTETRLAQVQKVTCCLA